MQADTDMLVHTAVETAVEVDTAAEADTAEETDTAVAVGSQVAVETMGMEEMVVQTAAVNKHGSLIVIKLIKVNVDTVC